MIQTVKNQGFTPPTFKIFFWKVVTFVPLVFSNSFVLGQTIYGSTTPVLNQVYVYTFSAFCESTQWFVSPNGIILSQSNSNIAVRWNSPGTSYVRASGGTGVCSGGNWASLDFTMPPTLTILGFISTNKGSVVQTSVDLYNSNNIRISTEVSLAYTGRYTFTVPYSFTGKVKVFDNRYTWSPIERIFTNITTNQYGQDFVGIPNCPEYIIIDTYDNRRRWYLYGNLTDGHQYEITITYDDDTSPPNPIIIIGQDICYEEVDSNELFPKQIKNICIRNITTHYQRCN